MKNIKFKSCYFSIAQKMLCNPEKTWSSIDFSGYNRNDIVSFLQYLVKIKALKRKYKSGRFSFTAVENPQKLLDICVEGFKDSESIVIPCISGRKHEDVLESFKTNGIKYCLGGLDGVRNSLKFSYDETLSVYITDRSMFKGYKLHELEYLTRINSIKSRKSSPADLYIIYPKYRKYLLETMVTEDGYNKPSDFYTYLYTKTSKNPLCEPQAEYIVKQLRGKDGAFLSWKK